MPFVVSQSGRQVHQYVTIGRSLACPNIPQISVTSGCVLCGYLYSVRRAMNELTIGVNSMDES